MVHVVLSPSGVKVRNGATDDSTSDQVSGIRRSRTSLYPTPQKRTPRFFPRQHNLLACTPIPSNKLWPQQLMSHSGEAIQTELIDRLPVLLDLILIPLGPCVN